MSAPPFVQYVQAGLSCIPIRADGTKAAAIPWSEYNCRLPTVEEAEEWERRYEGVAIIGGPVSGNMEAVDVDEPALVRPYLEAVKAQDPSIYDRLCLIRTPRRNATGQAGCHVIYRCQADVTGNTKLAMSEPEPAVNENGQPVIDVTTGKQKITPRTLIETRGEGGYVATVGSSKRCHRTGNLYEHVHGPALTGLETISAAERETLHRVARLFDRSVSETHVDPVVRGYERRQGESPGDDFNRRATWPEILGPHGWQCVGESGGIKHWRRPGKASGTSATTGILSKSGNELFTCFSTNAAPFEGNNSNGRPGVTYSKFGAFAMLDHHGDFEAAAKALLQLGYGTPAKKTEDTARVLRETAEHAEHRYLTLLAADQLQLVSLGIPVLDEALGGGVEAGEMIVVGGLPSHGKTVVALQAARAAVDAKGHVVVVSHEMGSLAIAKRLIQARTDWETRDWAEHAEQLQRESADYWRDRGKLFLLEQCRTIDAIDAEVSRIAAEFDLRLIVIDHAQLTEGKGSSRYEILTGASGRFKALAIKHNCPVLVPSQLNREAAKGGDAQAHHLKESGALEQDADVVILIQWPWKTNPDKESDPKRYVLRIVKNRNRPIVRWQVEAQFEPARQTIDAGSHPKRHPEFDSWSEPRESDGLF